MNRRTGNEMHVNLVKYYVYQQLKADEHQENLSLTMLQFDERWNIVYDSLRHFKNGYWNISPFFILLSQAISIYIPSCTVINLIHYLMVMWLPVVEIQYDVLKYAIKIFSLRIKKKKKK